MATVEKVTDKEKQGCADRGKAGGASWVQCEGFRCLGYKDLNGRWRNSFTGEILPKVIEIIEI